MPKNEIRGGVEAVLFAAGGPVETAKIAKFFKKNNKQLKSVIEEINKEYNRSNSGFSIIEKGSKIQLVTAPEFGGEVAKFLNRELGDSLSRAALEVLSVVAYQGPLTRSQIEHIRGVNCSFTLRSLAMRGLIERKENPLDNRSYVYEMSFDFMQSLGIQKPEQLPEYDNLNNNPQKNENEPGHKN